MVLHCRLSPWHRNCGFNIQVPKPPLPGGNGLSAVSQVGVACIPFNQRGIARSPPPEQTAPESKRPRRFSELPVPTRRFFSSLLFSGQPS